MRAEKKSKGCISFFLSFLVSLCLVTVLFFGGILVAKGFFMYKAAFEKTPMKSLVAEITSDEHYVSFNDLPEIYVEAVVSVEDKRFWEHKGLNIRSIGRAIVRDIQAKAFVEGGSSITQQLMKNEYFSQEKHLERKIADMFAAIEFEKNYSKKEIFEFYVNTIYFGSGYYGIYDAAMGYFGKTPWELSDYECIMLAGLPNAPSVYSLNANPDLAEERMNQVIGEMVEDGVITEEKAAQLRN